MYCVQSKKVPFIQTGFNQHTKEGQFVVANRSIMLPDSRHYHPSQLFVHATRPFATYHFIPIPPVGIPTNPACMPLKPVVVCQTEIGINYDCLLLTFVERLRLNCILFAKLAVTFSSFFANKETGWVFLFLDQTSLNSSDYASILMGTFLVFKLMAQKFVNDAFESFLTGIPRDS